LIELYVFIGPCSLLADGSTLRTLQLEFEVVTPSGDHIFSNECQFSDLFFALRGGGGGTFGVVMGITTLTLPKMAINW